MPRDDQKIIRTPSFRAKLNQITGMEPEEKALVVRIGNLLDFLTYSQRQESNPLGRSRKNSSAIPVPQNVTATGISGGFTIEWSPVDFSELSFYQLDIDTSSVFSDPVSFEVIDTRFVFKEDLDETVYFRVRTVSKRGEVSAFSSTASVLVTGSNIEVDYSQIDFENRTTVLPKPTLTGSELSTFSNDTAIIGVGGAIMGSPLTEEDRHSGFGNNSNRKNEIAYDLIDASDPCTSIQQKVLGIQDDYIERSTFYSLAVTGTTDQAFYYKTFIYPSSFVDFFDPVSLSLDPTEINVEFLRYREINRFYQPDYPQTGVILSGTMGILKI